MIISISHAWCCLSTNKWISENLLKKGVLKCSRTFGSFRFTHFLAWIFDQHIVSNFKCTQPFPSIEIETNSQHAMNSAQNCSNCIRTRTNSQQKNNAKIIQSKLNWNVRHSRCFNLNYANWIRSASSSHVCDSEWNTNTRLHRMEDNLDKYRFQILFTVRLNLW